MAARSRSSGPNRPALGARDGVDVGDVAQQRTATGLDLAAVHGPSVTAVAAHLGRLQLARHPSASSRPRLVQGPRPVRGRALDPVGRSARRRSTILRREVEEPPSAGVMDAVWDEKVCGTGEVARHRLQPSIGRAVVTRLERELV